MAVALMDLVVNKLRFLSDFEANIMQEKDQKSFFDLYSGSKEIDFLEKFGIGPVILKKVLCIVSLTTSKVTRCCLPLQTYADNQKVNCFFWVQDFASFSQFPSRKRNILTAYVLLNLFKAVFDSCLYLKMQCVTGHNIFNSTFSVGILSLLHIQGD